MTIRDQKLLLVEFNELVPELVNEYMEKGYLPNFAKLAKSSQRYVTDANQKGEYLNPWIQWVTVHTGLSPEEHKVFRLNESNKCQGKYIWDQLSEKGKKSIIFGSMNACYQDNFNGVFLPDPWEKTVRPTKGLVDYYEFVKSKVQGGHSRVSAADFVKFMLKNGLSTATIIKIVKQLASEVFNKKNTWKRASILDWLQLDVFRSEYKKHQPQFATFFSNSTAHIQHHYWMESYPEQFSHKIEKKLNENPMLESYKNHDALLGEILKLADETTEVAICTALSQQPFVKEVKSYYHINNFEEFVKTFNIEGRPKYIPVMAEQFHLQFSNEQDVEQAFAQLSNYQMLNDSFFYEGSNKVFSMSIEGKTLHVKCRCAKDVAKGTLFKNVLTNEEIDFYNVFYKMDDLKSGVHHPHGIFWMTGLTEQAEIDQVIPLESVHQLISEQVF